MAIIGTIATVLAGIVALVLVLFAVKSIPDFARYRRLRKM